jgi:hypothetical protein
MTLESLETWLSGRELTQEQAVLASLAYSLARSFDDKPLTSTAAELRKTVEALARSFKLEVVEEDPLAEMLRR